MRIERKWSEKLEREVRERMETESSVRTLSEKVERESGVGNFWVLLRKWYSLFQEQKWKRKTTICCFQSLCILSFIFEIFSKIIYQTSLCIFCFGNNKNIKLFSRMVMDTEHHISSSGCTMTSNHGNRHEWYNGNACFPFLFVICFAFAAGTFSFRHTSKTGHSRRLIPTSEQSLAWLTSIILKHRDVYIT